MCNCSLLFTELPLLDRPAAAREAGFDAVEFWWPFAEPEPGDRAVDAFVAAVAEAGVRLVGLNFFGGDLAGPDCGVLSIPDRSAEFRAGVAVAATIAERLDVEVLNALYGNRVPEVAPDVQDALAVENLLLAAEAVAGLGATVLVEPISGPKPYPLRTAADVLTVVDRVRAAGAANVGFLCDVFHLATNGDDVDVVLRDHAADIAHVQIADVPGRGEPGTGTLDVVGWLHALRDQGYGGRVALEYKPTVPGTPESLRWLPPDRRGGGAGAHPAASGRRSGR